MKTISTLLIAGCAVTFVLMFSPDPAQAQCEALQTRLDNAKALEEIHRRNAANRRDLHNEIFRDLSAWRKSAQDSAKENCKGDASCEQKKIGEYIGIVKSYWGYDIAKNEQRLDGIQADLKEVSGKLEATVAEKKFVSASLEKCRSQEASRAEAQKKSTAARQKSKANARQRAASQARRDAEAAANAAATAAAIGSMIDALGRSGISRGRPGGGGGLRPCPPGQRRSADNSSCHTPGGRRW